MATEVSKNFDSIISVYNFQVNPTRNELFTSAGGFVWDQDYSIPRWKTTQ